MHVQHLAQGYILSSQSTRNNVILGQLINISKYSLLDEVPEKYMFTFHTCHRITILKHFFSPNLVDIFSEISQYLKFIHLLWTYS